MRYFLNLNHYKEAVHFPIDKIHNDINEFFPPLNNPHFSRLLNCILVRHPFQRCELLYASVPNIPYGTRSEVHCFYNVHSFKIIIILAFSPFSGWCHVTKIRSLNRTTSRMKKILIYIKDQKNSTRWQIIKYIVISNTNIRT